MTMKTDIKLNLSRTAARALLKSLDESRLRGVTLVRGRYTADRVQLHFRVVGEPEAAGTSPGEGREHPRPLAS
jgi:hypothetical protein